MARIHQDFTDFLNTKRLQTLQSVDNAVYQIYTELQNLGELENTYIIYTSDHGLFVILPFCLYCNTHDHFDRISSGSVWTS